MDQACVRLALAEPGKCGQPYLCLGADALMRVGKKTFMLHCSNYIDTLGRGVLGPEKRGLERLFNITSNYITVRLVSAATCRTSYRTVNPQIPHRADPRAACGRWLT